MQSALSGWVVVAAWLVTAAAGYFGLGEFLSRLAEVIDRAAANDIGVVLRHRMYFEDYGDEKEAMRRARAPARTVCRSRSAPVVRTLC